VWGGQHDPVHFQYPGFVVPSQEGLPWWAQVAMPSKSVDILATPAAKESSGMFHDVWCGWFPDRPECLKV
jgi:hypothetical protein